MGEGYYWERYGQFDGLTRLDEVELDNEPYQFYILAVWKDEAGLYYLATDSGCSCPTPWESTTRDELTGPLTANDAREEANSLIGGARGHRYSAGPNEADVEEFLSHIV